MPAEQYSISFASTERMPGLFSYIRLRVDPGSVILSRVNSPAGMSLLADHDGTRPLARVREARIEDGVGYARVETPHKDPPRAAPYLEEIRAGLRTGISPGFIIHASEIIEDSDGEIVLEITLWEPYEISSTPIPRMRSVGLLRRDRLAVSEADIAPVRRPGVSSGNRAVRAGLPAKKRAASPLPSGGAATLSTRELDLAKREARLNQQTRTLDNKIIEQAEARNGKATPSAGPAPTEPLSLADSVSALARYSQSPSAEHVPDGVKVTSGRPGQVMAEIPASVVTLAFTSGTTPTIETVGAYQLPDADPAARILALCQPGSPVAGAQSYPIMTVLPTAAMVAEGAVLALSDPTFQNPAPEATVHRVQARAAFTLEQSVQGGTDFRQAVEDSLGAASRDVMAEQVLTGNGTLPNVTGVLNVTGVQPYEYAATDKGSAATFRAVEDLLDEAEIDERRRAYVLATDLYRSAKTTLREPGNAEYVIAGGRVLDETLAIRTSKLAAGTGILAEWSKIILSIWPNITMIIDSVTQPGDIRLTAITWFDVNLTDTDAVVTIAPVTAPTP